MSDRDQATEDEPTPEDQATPARSGHEQAIAGGMSPAEREVIGRRGYDEGEDESQTENEEH